MGEKPEPGDGPDLSFVTTEEMVEEIKRRSDGMVLIIVNSQTMDPGGQSECLNTYRGRSAYEALGMAVTFCADLVRDLMRDRGDDCEQE